MLSPTRLALKLKNRPHDELIAVSHRRLSLTSELCDDARLTTRRGPPYKLVTRKPDISADVTGVFLASIPYRRYIFSDFIADLDGFREKTDKCRRFGMRKRDRPSLGDTTCVVWFRTRRIG